MTNANNELIKKIRDVIEKGGNIDVNTRDVLLFSAIVDIYEQLENTAAATQKAIQQARDETARVIEDTRPMIAFYRVGLWAASAVGIGIIGFIGALITGQIEVIFK